MPLRLDGEPPPAARRACSSSREPSQTLPVRRRRPPPGAVAAARLLGAGASGVRLRRRKRARVARRARQRRRQPLGCGAAPVRQRDPAPRASHRDGAAAPLPPMLGARRRRSCSATARAIRALHRPRARDRPTPRMSRRWNRSIDPEGVIGRARIHYIERALAASLRDDFVDAYRHFRLRVAYAPSTGQAGPRKPGQPMPALSAARSTTMPRMRSSTSSSTPADNMTDSIAALAALQRLRNHRCAMTLFARFETRWHNEPLVLDKWFALQAQSARDGHACASCARCSRTRASTRAIRTACARWSAHSRCATSRASTLPTPPATRLPPNRCCALDAINPQLARRSPARSTCGAVRASRGAA